nr:hypothetical protein [Tanacetum cinerariifolium]
MPQPMQNPKDSSDSTASMIKKFALLAKAFKVSTTPTNNNQRSSLIPRNSQNAQPGMNTSQDIKMQMVDDNVGNQVRHNAMQFGGNEVGQNTVQNLVEGNGNGNGINGNPIRCFNCRGDGHYASNCTVKSRKRDVAYLQQQLQIAQEEEAWIQRTQEEFKFMATADAYDETERESAEVHLFENCYDNDIFNMFTQEEHVEQDGGIVEQHSAYVEETRAYHESLFHNLAAKVEKVNSVNQKMKETNAELTTELARYKDQETCFEISQEKYDKLERCYQKSVYQEDCLTKKINALHLSSSKEITTLNKEISNLNKQLSKEKSTVSSLQEEKKRLKSDFKIQADESLAKHKALELEIERLLRAIVSQDIMSVVQNNSVVDSSNLQTELERTKERFENCNIKKRMNMLNFRMIGHHSWNEYIAKQSILEKPPTSSRPKLYVVTPLPKSKAIPKIDESRALSKPVASNLVPTPRKSKVVKNDNVISLGIFRINPFKASKVDNFVPNKHVKPSVRTKPINVSQPHVITKNDANSNTNGFSTKDVKSTTRNKRPLPRNNPKNDKVPSKSKSSRLWNNVEKIEENHRNLQSSSNKKICHLNVINLSLLFGMLNLKLFVLCHKAQVWKPKNVGSKERLASPKPSTPRSCLRWSPTRRLFDLKGKKIATSESKCQSDCFKGDNACTSNSQEPTSKRFPNSTFSMTGDQNWFATLLIPLSFEYKPMNKEDHGDNEFDRSFACCDLGSRSLHHYPLCHLVILCHYPHAHDLESFLTISPLTYALLLDRFDNNVSFKEEVVHQRLRKTLTHVLKLSSCIYLNDRAWGVLNFDSAGVRL